MSDFNFTAKNRKTGEVIDVTAMDNHFGHHRYGYKTGNRILTEEEFDLAYTTLDVTPTPPPTERTDEQNKAILDHARPLIEENRRLLGLDTTPPPTGTCCKDCLKIYSDSTNLVISEYGKCLNFDCKCHTPPPTEGWEGRFRMKWEGANTGGHNAISTPVMNEIVSDIQIIITQALAEQKARMVEEVEGIQKETRNFPMKSNGGNWDEWNEGYDKACSDIIKALSK